MSLPADGSELRITWAYARGAAAGVLTWSVEPRGGGWLASARADTSSQPLCVAGASVVRGPGGEVIVTTSGGELRAVVGSGEGGGESPAVWYATTTVWGRLGVSGGCYEAPGAELARAEVGQRG